LHPSFFWSFFPVTRIPAVTIHSLPRGGLGPVSPRFFCFLALLDFSLWLCLFFAFWPSPNDLNHSPSWAWLPPDTFFLKISSRVTDVLTQNQARALGFFQLSIFLVLPAVGCSNELSVLESFSFPLGCALYRLFPHLCYLLLFPRGQVPRSSNFGFPIATPCSLWASPLSEFFFFFGFSVSFLFPAALFVDESPSPLVLQAFFALPPFLSA